MLKNKLTTNVYTIYHVSHKEVPLIKYSDSDSEHEYQIKGKDN